MATEQEPGPSVLVLPNGPVRPSEAAALRVSLNLLPEPAMVFAIDGTILQANASALSLLEGVESELIGKSIYSLCSIGPEKNREVAAHLGRGATIRFEMDFRTLKGHSRRVDSINMPVVTVAGKVESVIGFARDISERKRVENERAMMAAVVESSGDAIMTMALDGTITSWNRRAEELFGFTQAAAIGLPFLIMVPPEKRPLAMSMVEEIKANRERAINFEGPALRSDGGVIEILTTLFGIYNREGKLLGLSSIMRDITERKRAESAQRMLAAIVNASEDAIVSLALDNRIDSWNSGAEKLFGVAPENALGRNMLELVPPQDHARIGDALAELSRTGKPSSFRLHSSRKDGAAFDMWVNLFPIYDASGKLSAVGGIGRDVADLVKLRNEDAALATIVTASQDAIIGFSKELKITIWNPAAEKLYGFTATEAIGRGFDLFVPPGELASAVEADRRVLETGEPITFQQRAQKKDGEWFVSQVNIFPIRDAAGRIVAGAGIGRDITGLLKLESQQALLAAIVESSDDAIISLSPEFKIMTWNKGAQNLFGFTAAEAIGKTNLELYVPAEDRELVKGWMQDDFAAIIRNAAFVRRFDWLGKKNDGTAVDVGLVVSGIHDARGDLIGLSLMMRDITERNRAESEKAVFAAIVDASHDAIIKCVS
jgi:PAS domain S-box-containing protein